MPDKNQSHTVLLVDDEPTIAAILGNALQREGYKVVVGSNGEEGLAIALAQHPDIILTDVQMPKMTGLEMIAKIREDDPWGKNVNIIVLTNFMDGAIINSMMEAEKQKLFYVIKGDSSVKSVIAHVNEHFRGNVLVAGSPDAGISEGRSDGQPADITYS